MAISDKVIDLAPVNKTRRVIVFVLIGILAAASILFLVLYLLKPNVTPSAVNSVNIVADELFHTGGEDGEVLEASQGCEYTVKAVVGTVGEADKTGIWERLSGVDIIKAENGDTQTIEVAEDGTVTVSCRFRVTGNVGEEATMRFTPSGAPDKWRILKFNIVRGGAGDLSIDSISRNQTSGYKNNMVWSDAENTYSLDSALPRFPLPAQVPYNRYTVRAHKIQESTKPITPTSLEAESSDDEVIVVNSANENAVQFTVQGTGDAVLTIKAVDNNGGYVSKTLKIRVESADDNGVITGYYLVPDGIPSDADEDWADSIYNRDNKINTEARLTLYNNEIINIADYVLVRPFSRQKNFVEKLTIVSVKDDSSQIDTVTRDVARLQASQIAGTTKLKFTDTTSDGIGSSQTLTFDVKYRLQSAEPKGDGVTPPQNTGGTYSVAAAMDQKSALPIAYKPDRTGAFEVNNVDCSLRVYTVDAGGTVSTTPYNNKGGIVFENYKDGILSVGNATIEGQLIKAQVEYTPKSTTPQRFRFVTVTPSGPTKHLEFDVNFTVSVAPKRVAFDIPTGGHLSTETDTVNQFTVIEKSGDNNAILTINRGASPIDLATLLQYYTEGNQQITGDARAYSLSCTTITLSSNSSGVFTISEDALENKQISAGNTLNSTNNHYIKITLRNGNSQGASVLSDVFLYIHIVDNVQSIAVGVYSGNTFTPQAQNVEVLYKGSTTAAYNRQSISLMGENKVYRKLWSGETYEPISSGFDVAIRVGDTTLTPYSGDYYISSDHTGNPLFTVGGGLLYCDQDVFVLRHLDAAVDYSQCTVTYSLPNITGVVTTTFTLVREIDSVDLYTDAACTTKKADNAITVGLYEEFALHIGATFTYKDTDGNKSFVLPISDLTSRSDVERVTYSTCTADRLTNTAGTDSFAVKTGATAGSASIQYNVGSRATPFTVSVTITDNAAPVSQITFYTDSTTQYVLSNNNNALKGNTSQTIWYVVTYDITSSYTSYAPVMFTVTNVSIKNGTTDITQLVKTFNINEESNAKGVLEGSFTLAPTANGSAEFTAQYGNKIDRYSFTVTTDLADNAKVAFASDAFGNNTYYSGNTESVSVALTSASAQSFEVTPSFPNNGAFEVTVGNYDESHTPQTVTNGISVSYANNVFTVRYTKVTTAVQAVTLTFTHKSDPSKVYTLTLNVTVTANVFSIAPSVQTVVLPVDGTNTDGSVPFTVTLNNDNADFAPNATVTASVKNGVTGLSVDVSGKTITVRYKKNISVPANCVISITCGSVTITVPVSTSRDGYVLSFADATQFVYGNSTTRQNVTVQKYGTSGSLETVTTLPSGFAVEYSVTNAIFNTDKSRLTTNSAYATAVVTATLKNGATVYAMSAYQITFDNRVYTIGNGANAPTNAVGGKDAIWVYSGGAYTFDKDWFTLLNYSGNSISFTENPFTITATGGITVSGLTITVPAGSTTTPYTVTLSAYKIAGDSSSGTVSRTISVYVIAPTVSLSQTAVTVVEADTTAKTVTVGVAGLGVASGTEALTPNSTTAASTATESKLIVSVSGSTVSITPKAGINITANVTETVHVTITFVNGKTITADISVTITPATLPAPTFKVMWQDGSNWHDVDGTTLYTDTTYKVDRTDGGRETLSLTGVTLSNETFTVSGTSVTIGATYTRYGKTSASTSKTFTVVDRSAAAITSVSYSGGNIDPNASVTFTVGSNITINKNNDSTLGTPTYEIVNGFDLATVSGSTLTARPNTNGGSVTVRLTATYTSGVFSGQTVSAEFTVTVNSVTAPTATLTYSGNNPTLTVTQNETALGASAYSVSYAISSTEFGTIDATTGEFTPAKKTYAGTVTVTATVMINSGTHQGLVLTATFEIAVEKETEPTLTVAVNADTKVITIPNNFADPTFSTSNSYMYVEVSGNTYTVKNRSYYEQNGTITVTARCTTGVYAGRYFVGTSAEVTIGRYGEAEPSLFTVSIATDGIITIGNGANFDSWRFDTGIEGVVVREVDGQWKIINTTKDAITALTLIVSAQYNNTSSTHNDKWYRVAQTTPDGFNIAGVTPEPEPTFDDTDVTVTGNVITVTKDNFTLVSVSTENVNIQVVKDGNGYRLVNTSESEQTDVIVTVVAKYTLTGSTYENTLYSTTVTVASIAGVTPPEPEPTLIITPDDVTNTFVVPERFTYVTALSSNENIRVERNEGGNGYKLVNTSESDIESVTITVFAEYNDVGSSFNEKLFQCEIVFTNIGVTTEP